MYLITISFPTFGIMNAALGISKIALRQKRQIESMQISESAISNPDFKVIKTGIIMTVSYYLLWTPYFIFINIWELVTGHTLHPVTDFVFAWFGAISSKSTDIYSTLKTFRHKLIQFLHLTKWIPVHSD